MREYKSGRLWDLLKHQGPFAVREIARILDWSPEAVSGLLKLLARQGRAVGTGETWERQWEAIGKRPVNMIGKAPGSAIGRAFGSYMPKDLDSLHAAFRAKVLAGTYTRSSPRRKMRPIRALPEHSVFVGKIALEECWLPMFSIPIAEHESTHDNTNKPADTRALSVETAQET